jgi:benzoate-CoA ligase family protein
VSLHNAAGWLVDRHVNEGRGDRVAVRCEGMSTTYEKLLAEMWRVQRALRQLEVAEGDRVALVINDELAFPAWFLGSQRSGVVPIPLSTMLNGSELASIIADSGARTLVVSAVQRPALAEIVSGASEISNVVVIGDDETSADSGNVHVQESGSFTETGEMPIAATTEDSAAFWLYSSGTTGMPKGVIHPHGNPRATADTYATNVLEITEDDRFLSVAKLFFAYGLGNSLTFPFSVGATAILNPRPPAPTTMLDLIVAERPTLFFASPGFVAALLDVNAPADAFSTVRATITAGESLPANVQTRFAELTGHPVLDGIGSTELLHIFISNTLDQQTPGSSGRTVPGYVAEIRDQNDQVITEADTPGYLHVQGPTAATGYWQRDEATAAAFRDGWVRTGDVYTRSADDHWTFLGRNNDMIKAGGIWVSPAEVESVLIEHPDVLEAAVVGSRNDVGLETIVAFVIPASGSQPDTDALQQHCRDRMASFKRPREIIIVDELPKTATGKIKRFALRNSPTNDG